MNVVIIDFAIAILHGVRDGQVQVIFLYCQSLRISVYVQYYVYKIFDVVI